MYRRLLLLKHGKKDEEQLLEAIKAMKNVDWKKVIKVLAKIQQTEGKDDEELNKLLDKWEDVYDDVFNLTREKTSTS
jgi:hypothetical protein